MLALIVKCVDRVYQLRNFSASMEICCVCFKFFLTLTGRAAAGDQVRMNIIT